MSGHARTTLLSGINKEIQRRQLERLCKCAEMFEEDFSTAAEALRTIWREDLDRNVKRLDGRLDGVHRVIALLAACALGGFWQRRRARRELRAMLAEAGKSATLSRRTQV